MNGSQLRPRKPSTPVLPTIAASSEGSPSDDQDLGSRASLHAESFVTASDSIHSVLGQPVATDTELRHPDQTGTTPVSVNFPSLNSPQSESFIYNRWDRDTDLGSGGGVTFKIKPRKILTTPAFWAFWLGFLCPVLWVIGGWHFTNFGEQPPMLTFWEFYFNAGYWRQLVCCRGRDKGRVEGKGKGRADPLPLPRWVTEMQSSEDKRARLQDPKRSLKGISFGYPFVSRTTPILSPPMHGWLLGALKKFRVPFEKLHRIFDMVYGVKLTTVRGKREVGRRMFDPWIQRCRYATCYLVLILLGVLGATSTTLIVYSTRDL